LLSLKFQKTHHLQFRSKNSHKINLNISFITSTSLHFKH